MTYLGLRSAALIATGIVIPLGVEAASLTNFVGYIAWCLWLIALAVVLWRGARNVPPSGLERRAGRQVGRSGAPLRWTRSALTFQSRTAAARS